MKSWTKAVNQDKENGVSQDESGQSVHEIINSTLDKK